jgi:hypothetical protein
LDEGQTLLPSHQLNCSQNLMTQFVTETRFRKNEGLILGMKGIKQLIFSAKNMMMT